MASGEEAAVFAETNLGTHIAMAVHLDITAGDFKRQLEKTHASCFPSFGEIQVYGLMVKQKSCFYYLPEALPIKHIFRDLRAAWFICAEARLVNGSHKPCISDRIDEAIVGDDVFNRDSAVDALVFDAPFKGIIGSNNGKERRIKKSLTKQSSEVDNSSSVNKKSYKERIGCPVSKMLGSKQPHLGKRETLGSFRTEPETIPAISVAEATETTNRDFIVTSGHRTCLKSSRVRKFPLLSPKDRLKPGKVVNKRGKSGRVGKKLLVASNNIRMQGKKQVPSSLSSIYRSKTGRRLLDSDSVASLAKYLVFEISESEE